MCCKLVSAAVQGGNEDDAVARRDGRVDGAAVWGVGRSAGGAALSTKFPSPLPSPIQELPVGVVDQHQHPGADAAGGDEKVGARRVGGGGRGGDDRAGRCGAGGGGDVQDARLVAAKERLQTAAKRRRGMRRVGGGALGCGWGAGARAGGRRT